MIRNKPNIVLIGFMGVGKSSVGRELAKLINYRFIDLDTWIEQRTNKTISEIFAQQGEAEFRLLEANAVAEVCREKNVVIAAGGGSVVGSRNLSNLRSSGVILHLDAPLELLIERIAKDSTRPLAQLGSEGLGELYNQRKIYYELADYQIFYGSETGIKEVAQRILGFLQMAQPTFMVQTSTKSYPYRLSANFSWPTEFSELAAETSSKALLVTDEKVGALYGQRVAAGLSSFGWDIKKLVFPSGEETKSLENLQRIWEAGFAHGLDRSSVIFALGGGVIGDLSGFAAATYMRGVQFVILPTTLLAMVDSSVGGKVGINHQQGKNLVGSFHHPRAVLAFIGALASLDERNLAAGWAEVVKSALIGDPVYYDFINNTLPPINDLEIQAEAVFRSAKVKAKVVAKDEFEENQRKSLNLGHTLGHGFEKALGYGTWLHGEAVSLGLLAAAWMAERLGVAEISLTSELSNLLAHYGLPVKWPQIVGVQEVVAPVTFDKKNRNGQITIILPVRPGLVVEERLAESDYRNLVEKFRGEVL